MIHVFESLEASAEWRFRPEAIVVRLLLALGGLTQARLAEASGVDQSLISFFQRGKLVPGPETLARLAQAAGWSLPLVDQMAAAAIRFRDNPRTLESLSLDSPGAAIGRQVSILAEAALFDLRLLLPADRFARIPREPSAQDAIAEDLWARLKTLDARQRRVLVDFSPAFRQPSLALRLEQESERLAAERPADAADLARLAQHVASLCRAAEAMLAGPPRRRRAAPRKPLETPDERCFRPEAIVVRLLLALGGLTQARLAEASGVDQSLISLFQRGKLVPSPETLEQLAQAAGWPLPLVERMATAAIRFRDNPATLEPVPLESPAADIGRRVAALAEAALLDFRLLLPGHRSTRAPRKPSANDAIAADLWARLEPLDPRQRRVLVDFSPAFRQPSLVLRLAKESERLAAERPADAAELGQLAKYVASLCAMPTPAGPLRRGRAAPRQPRPPARRRAPGRRPQ
ncbi:MAG TPA: helix-turn-helix transcriptional regulator [Thermoanaerobaculia bacterium]|nr:helix-turn-helix transcriptional regulator [Thermoanaerobaculia bacterium]